MVAQHHWSTVSEMQDRINHLRDTIAVCENQILKIQTAMQTTAEVASLAEPVSVPAPAIAPQPAIVPAPAPVPVHYRRWGKRPTRMTQLISIIEGRMNGDPWTVDMFISALRDESGGSLPASMQMNLPARLSTLCREGFLRRIARGQYVRVNASQHV